jgi:hypothetical protein
MALGNRNCFSSKIGFLLPSSLCFALLSIKISIKNNATNHIGPNKMVCNNSSLGLFTDAIPTDIQWSGGCHGNITKGLKELNEKR